jgi:DNA-binding IclR family transcriptional regulator
MAYLSPEELAAVVQQQGLPALAPNTITDTASLIAELEQIRQQGYAISSEERDLGAAGIAAPLFNSDQTVTAGIGIVGPVTRIMGDRHTDLIKTVVTIAAQISQQLGGVPLI